VVGAGVEAGVGAGLGAGTGGLGPVGGALFPGLGQLGVDALGAGSGVLQRGAGLLAKARSKGFSLSPSTRSSTVTRHTR
jgi:hypothetical protein